MRYYLGQKLDQMTDEVFDPNKPSIQALEQRTVLALINTNPVLDYPHPLPENVIPVAGVHIRDTKPLPEVIVDGWQRKTTKPNPNRNQYFFIV